MASATRESLAIDVAPLLARPPAPTPMLRRTVAAAGLGALVVVLADRLASSHTAVTYSASPSAAALASRTVVSQPAAHGAINRAPRFAVGPESFRLAADAGHPVTASPDASTWLSPVPVCALAAALAAVAFALIRPAAPSLAPSAWAMCSIEEEEENDPTYVLVTNLPDKATSAALLQHFAASGDVVNAFIEIVREGNAPTRRGVVQFSTWEGAALAIQTAKERPLSGVVLQVDPDLRPASVHAVKTARTPAAGDRKRSSPEEQGPMTSIIVSNLPASTTEESLADHFRSAGKVRFVRLFKRETSAPTGRAAVRFETVEDAKRASTALKDKPFEGARITLRLTSSPPDRFPAKPRPSFGPWTRDPQDQSPADEALVGEVTGLLKERDAAKQVRDYVKADEAQDRLLAQKIYFQDETRMWSRSLAATRPASRARSPATFQAWTHDSDDQSPADEALVAEVTALLQERDTAKKAREWAKADEVKASLEAKGVFIRDDTRVWSQTPMAPRAAPIAKPAATFKAWARDPEDQSAIDEATVAEVTAILQERDIAKKMREWAKADETRDRLLEKGVIFEDKSRTWRRSVISEAESQTVEILNLPPTITWDDLRSHFGKAGKVEFIYIASDPTTGIPRGPGTVRFSTPEEAQKAIAWLPQNPVRGSTLIARLSTKVQVPRRVSKARAKAAPKPAASKA